MAGNKKFDFAAAMAELEAIAQWFESDQSDIEAALAKYERGQELAAGLKDYLEQAQNRVEKIDRKFAEPAD